MFRCSICFVLAGSAFAVLGAPVALAQCSTCATPAVAYYQPQPTVAYYQPTVAYTQQARTGWYPGRALDRRRMRRWGVTQTASQTYVAGYAPYTAAYAPYTAAYTPYTTAYTPYTAAYAYTPTSYTAAYRPYVSAYAPLASTSYYSTTVARPVVMSPVGSACSTCGYEPCGCAQPACGSACSSCSSCNSCSTCDAGVGQAIYSAPDTGCASSAAGSGSPSYSSGPSIGPSTPQPQLAPNEPIPDSSTYETQRQESTEPAIDPAPVDDSSTYFEAPKLFSPRDRSASRPSVEVHDAVYRQPVTHHEVSHASQNKVDANGWYAVPADR